MMNCICHKYLTEESTALVLHTVQMNNEKNKALNKIDAGAKAKCLFAESDLLPSEKRKKKKNQEEIGYHFKHSTQLLEES